MEAQIQPTGSNNTTLASGGDAIQPAAGYMWSRESPYLCVFYLSQTLFLFACYCLLVTCVYHNPRFHTSGYAMLISLMTGEQLINLTWHLGGTLPVTLFYAGFLNNYSYGTGRHVSYGVMASYFSACLHFLAITLQRYYSVVHYAKYDQVFNRRNTFILMLGLWMAGVLMALPYAHPWGPVKMLFSVEFYSLAYDLTDPLTRLWSALHNTGYNFTLTSLLVIFDCVFLYKLRKVKRTLKIHPIAARSSSRPSSRLSQIEASQVSTVCIAGGHHPDDITPPHPLQPTHKASRKMQDEFRLTMQVLILTVFWSTTIVIWFIVNTVLSNVHVDLDVLKVIYLVQTTTIIWTFGVDPLLVLLMNKTLQKQAVTQLRWLRRLICCCFYRSTQMHSGS